MTVDTGTFAAITGRLDEFEARITQIDVLQASQNRALKRQDTRLDAVFEAFTQICRYARVPLPWAIRRPRHLRLVRPEEGGAA